jgi:environmental stress-induced protein Ves
MAGQLHRFERDSLPRQRWKNGAGMTRELVCQPAGAAMDAADWRVSIAEVAADGPFSVFAGVERAIVLLDGPGLHLHSVCGALDHRLDKPGEPLFFAGELKTFARLLGGPSEDLNVMTRRQRCRAGVQVLQAGHALQGLQDGLVLALEGRWSAPAHPTSDTWLQAGEGLWWADHPMHGTLLPDSPQARLLLVQIQYHA